MLSHSAEPRDSTSILKEPHDSKSVLEALPGKLDIKRHSPTVMPTKSDSDVILCLELLSKTQTCTLHLS